MEIGFKHKEQRMEDAQNEIIAVLEKHDLMGSFTLSSEQTASFFTHVGASLSCAKLEEEENGAMKIRVKIKQSDFPSRAECERCAMLTIQGLMGLLQGMGNVKAFLSGVVTELSRKVSFKFMAFDARSQNAEFDE